MARRHRPRGKQRRAVPAEAVVTTVDSLAHDGRGIAHCNGKAVFIHDALPGETVRFHYTACHSQYDEARVEEIIEPSADRVNPRCAHFGVCGGCNLQHLAADRQIVYKQEWLLENLNRIANIAPVEVLPPLLGPHWHYRHKARLGVKFVQKKGRVLVGFREREQPFIADMQSCAILHQSVATLLPELAILIQELSIYNRLPQIEVAVGDNATALSLRVLDPPSAADLSKLKTFAEQHDLQIYLQTKGPASTRLLAPEQAILQYQHNDLSWQFLPYHFTQVNFDLNRLMIEQVLNLLQIQAHETVLELFCGLGNFTLPLAKQAAYVAGVEGEQSLIDRAKDNAARNEISNAEFFCADLNNDVSDSTWLQQSYHKILLDPPRSGALQVLPQIAQLAPERLVYVSCHPATLARDAGELVHNYGYRLLQAGVMDMFPHTAHVESIALFERYE